LVKELKANPGNSERHYAEASGIAQGQIASVLYKAELEADPSKKLPATQAGVVKGRNAGLRWPRIAAYTGLTITKVKELAEAGGVAETYSGRGRKFDGSGAATPARGASGRKKTSSTSTTAGTSGRRGSTRKTASSTSAAPAGQRGRRGTRSQASSPK
jgi:hypothetical protein